MLKRSKDVAKTGRKRRKKGDATYQISTLDQIDKSVVEDIRVWNFSTSERTGRITAKRRILKHQSQGSSGLPDEPSTSKPPGCDVEVAHAEETGILADIESSEVVDKPRPKRKRTRVTKENDSVSGLLALPTLELTRVSRQRWSSGLSTVRFFLMNCSVSMALVTRTMVLECVPTA